LHYDDGCLSTHLSRDRMSETAELEDEVLADGQ